MKYWRNFFMRSAAYDANGAIWEQRALEFLQKKKLRLIQRNYRCKEGEIDLIMHDSDNVVVFVEVRARTHATFGGAAASVDYYKQQRIAHAALHYLHRFVSTPVCRFDVIAFEQGKLVWYQNAFTWDS